MILRKVSATILAIFMLYACGGGGNEGSATDAPATETIGGFTLLTVITETRSGVDDPTDIVELTAASRNLRLIDHDLTSTAYSISSNTSNHTFLMAVNGGTINRILLYAADNWGGGVPPNLYNWRIYSTDILGTPWNLETAALFFTAYDNVNQHLVIQIPQDVSRNYLKLVVDRGATVLSPINITEVQVGQRYPPPAPLGAAVRSEIDINSDSSIDQRYTFTYDASGNMIIGGDDL